MYIYNTYFTVNNFSLRTSLSQLIFFQIMTIVAVALICISVYVSDARGK